MGFFSFLRGGGTGASPLVPSLSFLTIFLTTFFLGGSAVLGDSGVEGAESVFTEDSIWAAVLGLDLMPICESETAPTGGVGTVGSWTERRESADGDAGEGESAGGVGPVTVGVRNSLAMMDCASAAASSASLSGVSAGSAASGGLSCNLPAGLRRSSATQPSYSLLYSLFRLGVALVGQSH
uniref:Uncharacterized protein n=1 Tax=Pararge aegeria TaxID=116150 RepID=S4PTG8_9NEOP